MSSPEFLTTNTGELHARSIIGIHLRSILECSPTPSEVYGSIQSTVQG
jgi:hypothetical protein